MKQTIISKNVDATTHEPVNWRQVGGFLALTFALTWTLDATLWLSGAYEKQVPALMTLQLQMLIPAFSAILLGLFVFKNSPFYFNTYHKKPVWFFYFYLLYSLIYLVLTVMSILLPNQATILSAVSSIFIILGVIVLVAIRVLSNGKEFAEVNLSGGKFIHWIIYGIAFIVFYALQAGLNALFGLGQPVDQAALLDQLTQGQGNQLPLNVFLAISFLQSVIIGPLIGILLGFGEEYGWRGFLQGELVKLGKARGILILGLIWGIWHYPVIWMGHNYPGQPVWGTFLMTGYTILLGFILGYIMLKTGSIWLVAFLHALNNQVLSYTTVMFYRPESAVFSFGIGLYGILTMLPIVLFLLVDPIWRTTLKTPHEVPQTE